MPVNCVICGDETGMRNPRRITMKNGKPAIEGICQACGGKMLAIPRAHALMEDSLDEGDLYDETALFYTGIGRVLDVGYEHAKADQSSSYEEEKPAWIKIQVLEGALGLSRPHYQGDTIAVGRPGKKVEWDDTDIDIVGEPQIGETVGFYSAGYAQMLEKIETSF